MSAVLHKFRRFNMGYTFIKMLIVILASNTAIAEILWEKELTPDANTNSSSLASCLNKDATGIIVTTIECPRGSFPIKGDNILWEIGADGNAIRISPKNADGSKVQTNADPVGYGCAIAGDGLGNLLTTGILSKQKNEKGLKVAAISGTDKAEKIMSPRNPIESHSIKKMIPLQDNTFALVGDKNGDGLLLRIDNQGRVMQEKLLDMGQSEICTDVDLIKSDNLSSAVVGISFKISIKDPNESFAKYFIFICDPNQKTVHEDHFAGGLPGILFPKVCCLGNGNIIVLYKIKSEHSQTLLGARCYTEKLKLLWEKEVFSADKVPFFFDIAPYRTGDFIVWIGQTASLDFNYFGNDGMKIKSIQYKGSVTPGGAFGVSGFNLLRVNGKTIAVFNEGTAGNIKETSIRAKVIALD
jgi:hypothetical protein